MTLHKFVPEEVDDDDLPCIDVHQRGKAELPSLVQYQPEYQKTAAV
jgi:hypothetical protein